MKFLTLIASLILCSCVSEPKIVVGKGAVYGILSAESHPLIKKKNRQGDQDSSSYDENDDVLFKKDMVDYNHLKELYVGLVLPEYEMITHQLVVNDQGFSLDSLALSPGDVIHIRNNTAQQQNLFIVESEYSGFQGFPSLAAGSESDYVVKLEGFLELLSEEDESLKTILFSKKGMISQRLSSGSQYQFENLEPGHYNLFFWYWRLGEIHKMVNVLSDKNIRVDTVLSVESVMLSH